MNIPHKVTYETGDTYYFESEAGAYQEAGMDIISSPLGDYLAFEEITPEQKGTIAQIYQDALVGNWKSVYDGWCLLVGDNLNIWVEEVEFGSYKRKVAKKEQIEYIMEWFKGEEE